MSWKMSISRDNIGNDGKYPGCKKNTYKHFSFEYAIRYKLKTHNNKVVSLDTTPYILVHKF